MKKKLGAAEFAAVVAAIQRKPYESRLFKSGVLKMNAGSGVRPDFTKQYPDFPWRLTDFRAETTWSLGHVERHQAACDAAEREYWRVMTASVADKRGSAALRADSERLNWLERQHLEELSMQLVVDAKHDGEYYVCGDSNRPGYGPTLRAAIDAAMLAG